MNTDQYTRSAGYIIGSIVALLMAAFFGFQIIRMWNNDVRDLAFRFTASVILGIIVCIFLGASIGINRARRRI